MPGFLQNIKNFFTGDDDQVDNRTANSTPAFRGQVAELKVPEVEPEPVEEPQPTSREIMQRDRDRNVSISQSTVPEDEVQKRRRGPEILRKIGTENANLGSFLFGEGPQNRMNSLYQQDSIQQDIVEKGIVGFLTEGFQRQMNPTRLEMGERIYDRYSILKEKGDDDETALNAAIQDVIDQTPDTGMNTVSNVDDLKNPDIELTEEQKDALFWTNALEDAFAVLDAPIFLGTTKPVTRGGSQAVKAAEEPTRNLTGRIIDAIGDRVSVSRQYIEDLLNKPDIKEPEKEIAREVLEGTPEGSKVDAQRFADEMEERMLPLNAQDKADDFQRASRRLEQQGYDVEYDMDDSVMVLRNGEPVDYDELPTSVRNDVDALMGDAEGYSDAVGRPRYENVNVPREERGPTAVYKERIWESPVQTVAGTTHFGSQSDNYFAHSRFEDTPSQRSDFTISQAEGADGIAVMAKDPNDPQSLRVVADGFADEAAAQRWIDQLPEGPTRRILEIQSDLFQKGNLEREVNSGKPLSEQDYRRYLTEAEWREYLDARDTFRRALTDSVNNPNYNTGPFKRASARIEKLENKARELKAADRVKEVGPLEPYRNRWHERIVREEFRQAARDGVEALRFPTGQTAMKIEGLANYAQGWDAVTRLGDRVGLLTANNMKPGMQVVNKQTGEYWVIVETQGNGQFKAVPKAIMEDTKEAIEGLTGELSDYESVIRVAKEEDDWASNLEEVSESFDIKADIEDSPIYKFYERTLRKYLSKRYKGTEVTDGAGNTWIEIKVDPKLSNQPVEAFGAVAGLEVDEEGEIEGYDPVSALIGVGAFAAARRVRGKAGTGHKDKVIKETDESSVLVETYDGKQLNMLKKPEDPTAVFYHGTTADDAQSIVRRGPNAGLSKKQGQESPDAFFVGDITEAGMYGKTFVEVRPKTKVPIRTLDSSTQEYMEIAAQAADGSGPALRKAAKEAGYDAVYYGDEVEILSPGKFEYNLKGSNQDADAIERAIGTAEEAIELDQKLAKPEARQAMVVYQSQKGDYRVVPADSYTGTKNTMGALMPGSNQPMKEKAVAVVKPSGEVQRVDSLEDSQVRTMLQPKTEATESGIRAMSDIMTGGNKSEIRDDLLLEAFVARNFDEFKGSVKSADADELAQAWEEAQSWKADEISNALVNYKLAVSGGSAVPNGEALQKAIQANPEKAAPIAQASREMLAESGVTKLYRYGDADGLSWTTDPQKYFENGRELQEIEVTPEVLQRVVYADGAEETLGRQPFPNTGENEVIMLPGTNTSGMRTMGDIIGGGGDEAAAATQRGPRRNERRFVTRTRQMEPNMDEFLEGEISPRSTEELAKRADDLIASDPDRARDIAINETDDFAVAVASRLIDKNVNAAREATDNLQKTQAWQDAAEVANEAARNLTAHGRAIQAASLLGRTTPEGMVRHAARMIQNHNNKVDRARSPIERTLGGLLGTKEGKSLKKVPELTSEQAERITDRMYKIQGMTDETEKAIAMSELEDEIRSFTPDSLYKRIVTLWKAGLLTGLKTTGLNIASNTAHFASEIVKDVPATVVDKVVSLFTGKRTTAMTMRGTGSGLVEGAKKGWRYWKTGFDERDIGAKLDYRKVSFGTSKFAKALQMYEETVFRTIGSQDQPFYYASKARSLTSQAIADAKNKGLRGKEAKQHVEDLLQNPTDDMLKYAVLDAETAVFQNKTTLGTAARAIQRLPGGEIVLPFGKTPSAVATQIINYSPVGIVKTIIENAGKGKFDQRLFSQGIGRGMVGTAPVAIGMALYQNDLLTLGWPSSSKEAEQWKLEGRVPNAIKVNGEWRNVAVLGPAGLLLVIGGHLENGINETGSFAGGLAQSAAGFGNTLTEQSFLKGVNQAIEALQDPNRSFEGFASSLAGSVVPTLIADIARSTDEYERNAVTPGERFQSRIPGARQELEPRVDTLGNKVKTQGFWTVMMDATRPGNASAEPEDEPVVTELRRLLDAGYNATPTQLGPRQGYESLKPEQNTYLWRFAGTAAKQKMEELMNSRAYQRMDDEQKADAIEDRVQEVKVEARARTVLRATKGLEGRELQRKLAEMKQEGLLTRSVFNRYQALRR